MLFIKVLLQSHQWGKAPFIGFTSTTQAEEVSVFLGHWNIKICIFQLFLHHCLDVNGSALLKFLRTPLPWGSAAVGVLVIRTTFLLVFIPLAVCSKHGAAEIARELSLLFGCMFVKVMFLQPVHPIKRCFAINWETIELAILFSIWNIYFRQSTMRSPQFRLLVIRIKLFVVLFGIVVSFQPLFDSRSATLKIRIWIINKTYILWIIILKNEFLVYFIKL